jgi:hypothetical protein
MAYCPNWSDKQVVSDMNTIISSLGESPLTQDEVNLLMRDKDTFKEKVTGERLKAVYAAYNLWDKYEGKSELMKELPNAIAYNLKVVNGLLKISRNVFKESGRQGWENDLLKQGVPKEQIEFFRESAKEGMSKDDIIMDIMSKYGFVIKSEVAKFTNEKRNNYKLDYDPTYFPSRPYTVTDILSFDGDIEAFETKEEAEKFINARVGDLKNTSHYSNLTVPGGTNYTENEISTPLITPSIKGHAQFSTDNGIGWFRSDEQLEKANTPEGKLSSYANDLKPSKTRRILEVQSDLFQKGRDKQDLIGGTKNTKDEFNDDYHSYILDGVRYTADVYGGIYQKFEEGYSGQRITKEEFERNIPNKKSTKSNQFLQLLNKDSNWVTFFVKSIIQDSAKKGYEKVLFPRGETAAKVEGHQTLVAELENINKEIEIKKQGRINSINITEKGQDVWAEEQNEIVAGMTDIEKVRAEKEGLIVIYKEPIIDIIGLQLLEKRKSELKSQGIEKLKPIEAFYEIRITNILKKLGNVKEVTDEYGNTWNEVTITSKDLSPVMLQKKSTDIRKPNTKIDNKVKEWLTRIGVKVENLDKIKDKNGNVISAIAKANLIKGIVEIVEGKADIKTLSEEAGHFLLELMGPEHPLYKKMMADITKYEIYNEVVRDYTEQYKGDIEKLKKEAIGKAISQVIVSGELTGESVENMSAFMKWLNTVWNWVVSKFKRINSTEFEEFDSVFKEAAAYITENKTEGLRSLEDVQKEYKDSYEDSDFYELETTEQQRILQLIKDTPLVYDVIKKGYIRTTDKHNVKHRGTDPVKAYYQKLFGSPNVIGEKTSLLAMKGTVLHKYIESLINTLKVKGLKLEDKSSFQEKVRRELMSDPEFAKEKAEFFELTDSQFMHLAEGVSAMLKQIKKNQNSINPNGKAEILTEAIIYDDKKDIGSTSDMIVVYSNGMVADYDWKGINFKTFKGKVIKPVGEYKKEAFNIQLSERKRILKERYKIKEFRETRIVPINMQLNYGNNAVKGFADIEIGEQADKEYLAQIPVANEMTDDKHLNKTLVKQYEVLKILKGRAKKERGNKSLELQVQKLEKAIKKLIVDRDIAFVFSDMLNTMEQLNKRMGITNETSPLYLTVKDLNTINTHLSIYSDYHINIKPTIMAIENTEERAKLLKMSGDYARAISQAQADIRYKQFEWAEKAYGMDIREVISRPAMQGGIINSMNEYHNPGFHLAHDLLTNSSYNTDLEVKEISENIEKIHDAYKKWAKAHGKGGIDIFEFIRQKDSNSLTRPWTSKFWEDKNKAIKDQNVEWFKKYHTFDREAYEEGKKRAEIAINNLYPGAEDREVRESELENYIRNHDVAINPKAYFNKSNHYIHANVVGTEYESKEYKYIYQSGNEALKDYYEMYIKYIKMVRGIVGYDKMGGFDLPNIHKDMIDMIGENGVAGIMGIWGAFKESFIVRQDDEMLGSRDITVDPTTKKPIPAIPLVFLNKMDDKLVSKDLTKSLIEMMRNAINYKNMKEIEESIIAIRTLMQSNEMSEMILDRVGRVKRVNGEIQKSQGISDATIAQYDRFINMRMYGQKIQGMDFGNIQLSDKVDEDGNVIPGGYLSSTKFIQGLQTYLSTKFIGLNPKLGLINYANATMQARIMGKEGTYFTIAQNKKAFKLITSNDKVMAAATGYFEVYSRDMSYERAVKTSASWITRNFTMKNMFIAHNKPDEFRDNILLGAMMQNYGISDKGEILRLSKLPEGSKSLYELASIKDDKFVIEGLTKEGYIEFRSMVRYIGGQLKGTISPENEALYRTYLIYSMAGFMKNWILPLAKSRFRALSYDRTMKEMEVGRFKVVFGDMIGHGFMPTAKEFLSLATEVISFGAYKKGMNRDRAEFYFERFLEEHPELEGKINIEEFMDLRERKFRAAATELRMWFYLLALAGGLAAAGWGGDDDKNPFTKTSYMLAKRAYLEMSFFLDPNSAMQFLQKPFPVITAINDALQLFGNTVDVGLDIVQGQNEKNAKGESTDNTPPFHYILKDTPGLNTIYNICQGFQETFKATENESKNKKKKRNRTTALGRIIHGSEPYTE